jgi:hypothetical protein
LARLAASELAELAEEVVEMTGVEAAGAVDGDAVRAVVGLVAQDLVK